jgi:hypothetical protein
MPNPWDKSHETDSTNSVAILQPVSAMLGSGIEFGQIANPGANCCYIENPLYVPMVVQPGNEFGFFTPSSIAVGSPPGLVIPPFSWATFPIAAEDANVFYDFRVYNRIPQTATSIPTQVRGPFARAFDLTSTTADVYPSSSLTQPTPRIARCYFYDTPSPQIQKGSLFRSPPLQYNYQYFIGDNLTGPIAFWMSPDAFWGASGIVTPFTPLAAIQQSGGLAQSFINVPINSVLDRAVITGVQFIVTDAPSDPNAWIYYGEDGGGIGSRGCVWYMDEFQFPNASGFPKVWPDMMWVPQWPTVPPVANVRNFNQAPKPFQFFRNKLKGSVYIPIPGARHVIFWSGGNIATPEVGTVEMSLTFYISEY